MKVISLNTWGGLAGKELLLDFFKQHSDADVFCLQEVWSGGGDMEGKLAGGRILPKIESTLFSDIGTVLLEFTGYFRPQFREHYGLATFVKNTCTVLEEGEVFVHKDKGHLPSGDAGNHARNVQYISLETSRGPRIILNFHGLWNGQGKSDSGDRLIQSDRIIAFLKRQTEPVVFCGDFNLNPDTQSMRKLEEYGLRNLITEHNITSTRTSFYTKPGKFADYILVSPQIDVKRFTVLPDEVSDHAPLCIEFE